MVSTQRLVRREFLRFGKRSGEQEEETLGMESEPNFEGLPEGKAHTFVNYLLPFRSVYRIQNSSFFSPTITPPPTGFWRLKSNSIK